MIISINLDCLKKSRLSWFIHIVSMQILTWPSLYFKNCNREKNIFDLDRMDNLDNLQKLVSTLRTISILTSIGLDCRDPQPYLQLVYCFIIFFGFFHSFPFILSSFFLPLYLPKVLCLCFVSTSLIYTLFLTKWFFV